MLTANSGYEPHRTASSPTRQHRAPQQAKQVQNGPTKINPSPSAFNKGTRKGTLSAQPKRAPSGAVGGSKRPQPAPSRTVISRLPRALSVPPSPAQPQLLAAVADPASPLPAQPPPGGTAVLCVPTGLEPILETSREFSSHLTTSSSGYPLCHQNGLQGDPIAIGPAATPEFITAFPESPNPGENPPPRRQWHQPAPLPSHLDRPLPPVHTEDTQLRRLSPQSCELDGSLFSLGRRIGSGAFATVYLARTLSPAAAPGAADPETMERVQKGGRGIGTGAEYISNSAPSAGAAAQSAQSGSSKGMAAVSSEAQVTQGGLNGPSSTRRCVVKKMDRVRPVKGFGGSEIEVRSWHFLCYS